MNNFITILLCFISFFAFSQSPDKEGFIALFDGSNLDGWTSSTENAASFQLVDSSLVCKGGRAHLFYSGPVGGANFKNFELKLSAKTMKGSNSGVYFHTKYQEKGWPQVGFEAQVNSTHKDPIKTGSLYGIVNMWVPQESKESFVAKVDEKRRIYIHQKNPASTDGEWFDYHIIVQNNTITLKVNGETTVQWTQPGDWNKKRRIGQGTIGLQAHDPKSETHFRSIRIKLLD